MTRPTRFGRPMAMIGGRLGQIQLPDSSPPSPDCCALGEIPPDRAADENGGYAVMLGGSDVIAYVQQKATTNTGISPTISVVMDAPPTVGNMLIAITTFRGGTSPSPATMPSGWTRQARYIGAAFDGGPAAIFTKVAVPGESSTVTVTKHGGVGARLVVLEYAGVAFDSAIEASGVGVATSLVAGPITPTDTPALLVAAFNQSARTGTNTWPSPWTEVDDAHIDASGPTMTVGYDIEDPASGAYSVTVTSTESDNYGFGMLAFLGAAQSWIVPAPLTIDGDDATYETAAGTEVLQVDIGAPFRIATARLVIGSEFAGSKTYELWGGNLPDLSDAVLLASVTFTATGSYTADTVLFSWDPTTEYEFFQLNGTSETRRIYTLELRELVPGTVLVTDPVTGDLVEVQISLDNIYGAIPTSTSPDASEVPYDNSESGLPDLNVQDAIDTLADSVGFGVDTVGSLTAGGSPQTVINDATHNAFPGLIRLDDSRVLTVYSGDGTSHLAGHELCGQIGTLNADRTAIAAWGTRFVIHTDTDDIRVEDGVSIIGGQIVVAFRLYDGSANNTPSLIICDDAPGDFTAASTWGTPVTFPSFGGSVQNYTQGYVHQLASGDYFVGAGKQSGGTHTVGIWKWDEADGVDDPSGGAFITVGSGAPDYAEIAVEELTPGNLMALVRSVTAVNIQQAASSDSGDTWGAVAVGYDGYGYPMFRKLLSGLGLTVYRDAPDGDNAWRPITSSMTVFGSETILDTNGTRGVYATLLQISPTKVLCLYAIEGTGSPATNGDIFAQWFTDSSTFAAVTPAPANATYLTTTANGTLSAEVVVGATPGGELGGTWAAPTVDATHAGSTHIALSSATPLIEAGSGSAGSGTQASKDDHVHPAAASSSGGEIVMESGTSSPPVPIWNSAGDDWVYSSS